MRTALLVASLCVGCGSTCAIDAPLDYDEDENWLCRPGLDRACPDRWTVATVDEAGGVSEAEVQREDSGVVCFSVYPTLDLRLNTGLHTHTEVVDRPETWTRTHAAQLPCEVYAPVYRQVRLGTYLGEDSAKKQTCFDSAFADVLAAFEAFVEAEPERPFALIGHSQGGQILSRLIAQRIEADALLRDRMVVAYPIGWPVGTAVDDVVGGSFATTPVCTAAEQSGCVVAFRTFVEGRATPTAGRFTEGERMTCVNPASPDEPEMRVAMDFSMVAGHASLTTPEGVSDDAIVRWPDAVEGRCTGAGLDRGLEIRWIRADEPPVNLDSDLLTDGNGSHMLDLNFTELALVEDLSRRAQAFAQ